MKVLVVGSVALDTLELPSGCYPEVLGGSATFAAIAASLFAPTRLVGVVGDDFGAEHTALLDGRGVDLAGLKRVPGRTFRWEGRYNASLTARETLRTELGVFESFRPDLPAAYKDSEIVVLGNIQPALQAHVLDQSRAPKLVVADTMNLWINTAREALYRTLERVEVFLLNDEEARQLTEEENLVRAARAIHALGPKIVVIKRGDAGALLFDARDGSIFQAPCYPTADVADPTGAGDAFLGAFAGALSWMAQGKDGQNGTTGEPFGPRALRRAALWGSAVGSVCVEGVGVEALKALTIAAAEGRVRELEKILRV